MNTTSSTAPGLTLPVRDIPELRDREDQIVFSTRHGSALYGFDTESSDQDWFVVTTSTGPRAHHRVIHRENQASLDVVTVGWDRFLELAYAGSHQSLEALFSREKVFSAAHEARREFLENTRVTGEDVIRVYKRTIKKFSFGDFKRRRHAVRLAGDLADLREYGRFDPRLSFRDASFAGNLAENLAGHALAGILLSQF